MRILLTVCLLSGLSDVAGAHTLSGDENLLSQLGHQLLGLHHLPLMAILVFAGIVVLRQLHRNNRRQAEGPSPHPDPFI